MNILVLAPTPYFSDRGCHIRIYEELAALHRAGHEAELFTYHLGRDEGPFPVTRIPEVQWYTKTSAGPAWGKLYLDLLLLRTVWKHRKRLRNFDVIHAHLHEGGWLAWWIQRFLKLPVVLDAQGSLVGELEQHDFLKLPGLRWVFSKLEGWIVQQADHIVTSSPDALNMLTTQYPAVASKTSLLEDAVSGSMEYPKDAEDLQPLRSVLKLNPTEPTVIYTGGLAAIKGIDYLLNAIPHVLKAHPTTQFVIVGYPHVERCRDLVEELGVADAVRFALRIHYMDLPKYLALADIGVDPKPGGAGEASGKSLNYMAAGLPVVTFASPNSQAMLGSAGELVEEVSAPALAASIVSVISSAEKQSAMRAEGLQRINSNYSWDNRIKDLVDTYELLTP